MIHSHQGVTRALLAGAAGILVSTLGIAGPASASSSPFLYRTSMARLQSQLALPDRAITFTTLDDRRDLTFNQLLGINDNGVICGYFGSGASGHPNKGYTLRSPYTQRNYRNENFPGSIQTQVTAIDNIGNTAGFWVDGNGNNFGFVEWNNVFTSYTDPNTGTGTVNQLLGINDSGIAVGFYVDGSGASHADSLNQATGQFTEIVPTGGTNPSATAINDSGDMTGFVMGASGNAIGWLYKNGTFTNFAFPRSTSTMPFGINTNDEIVGTFTDVHGATHGFTLTNPLTHAQFRKVDDPNGIGTTIVNGLNDHGQIVGFYVDSVGNTDGFLGRM